MRTDELVAEVVHGAAVFERLREEWDALAARGMTDTPFQTLAYQRAWWTHLGPGDLSTVVVRRRGDGALVGLLCYYLVDGLVHFNGCVEETDYLDLIAPEEEAEAVWRVALDCLFALDEDAWQVLDFCNVPAWSPSLRIVPLLLAERGLDCQTTVHEVCPVIELPNSFEGYLESLDRKQRHEVRRKLRRAEGADARYEVVGDASLLHPAVDDFLELLVRSTPDKAEWLNPERRAVFHEVAEAALAAGTLQLLFVGVEGQRAAGLFNFAYRDRVWVYNSGLDPDTYGWLSPGVILTARAIELAIDAGMRIFDFLRGDEQYKYRFGAVDTQIFRVRAGRHPG